MTYGFLLPIEIDGKGTVMTCNKVDGIFSWQGQASLGGYIGADSASLFSAVSSGAAGTYMGTLTADAGISTDLTIRAGQMVDITGDPGLAVASWGGGGFMVQQFGSLALSHVRLYAALSVVGGGSLALIDCDLRAGSSLVVLLGVGGSLVIQSSSVTGLVSLSDCTASLTGCAIDVGSFDLTLSGVVALSLTSMTVPAFVLNGATIPLGARSTLRLSAVTFASEANDAVPLTGTMTVGADGSYTIEPPHFNTTATFTVVSAGWLGNASSFDTIASRNGKDGQTDAAPCTVSAQGRCIGRPAGYGVNEECIFRVNGVGMLDACSVFDTSRGDSIYTYTDGASIADGASGRPEVIGRTSRSTTVHFGSNCPARVLLGPGDLVVWTSSGSDQGSVGCPLSYCGAAAADNGCASKGTCGLPFTHEGEGSTPEMGEPYGPAGLGGGWQICFA